MPLVRHGSALLLAALVGAGCAGTGAQAEAPAAQVPLRPLAGLAAQRIIVAPVGALREGDPLGWAAAIPRQRDWMRALDQEIAFALGERGLERAWVFPEALSRSYQRNPSLSPDPSRLAIEPLRSVARLNPDLRVPEPLATQLRTLVAMHDARYVLLPLEVAFEPDTGTSGRARLRLMLVDARSTEIGWLGDVRSDPSPVMTPAVAASLAARMADLIAAP